MPIDKLLVKKQFNCQRGFIHLGIILAILAALISFLVFNYFKPFIKPTISPNFKPNASLNPKPTAAQATPSPAVTQNTAAQVVKKDLEALEKYCKEEALKLPQVPFTYESKSGPTISGPMPWINQFISKDKKESEKISCTMTYRFNGRTAYGEMGAEYPGQGRKFDKAVRASLAGKLDSSWEKVTGTNISDDSFTMVYKRENPGMGTVDYVDAFDGGLVIYIKFNTYYK